MFWNTKVDKDIHALLNDHMNDLKKLNDMLSKEIVRLNTLVVELQEKVKELTPKPKRNYTFKKKVKNNFFHELTEGLDDAIAREKTLPIAGSAPRKKRKYVFKNPRKVS